MAKSNYWIKLYHEILDDPKMARLPDNLYRRTIELFLLAGENDADGLLPPLDDIAWRLRITEADLLADLKQLEQVGIVTNTDGWTVTNFAKRQAVASNAERQKIFRQDKHKQEYYGNANSNVTVTNIDSYVTPKTKSRNTDIDIDKILDKDKDIDIDRDTDPFDAIQHEIEQTTGYLSTAKDVPAIREMVTIGATTDDIHAAVAWFASQDKVARGAQALLNSVKYQVGKRKQAGIKAPENGKRKRTTSDVVAEAMAEWEAERTAKGLTI